MEMNLKIKNNPVVYDTRVNKQTGKPELRSYGMATTFNYGFIP
jgi:hypothetical protein